MRTTRSISKLLRNASAAHWVYILLYTLLVVLGLLLVMMPNSIVVAVGSSLVATGLAGLLLFLNVWLLQEDLHRLALIRKFGLLQAFELRGVPIRGEYDDRLKQARESIDIMGFGLRALREDYRDEFPKWASKAKVRILLIDPQFFDDDHSLAKQRDQEENDRHGKIAEDVRAFVRECASLLKRPESRFQVRLFRCLPSVNVFRIDHELFWGPYLIDNVSRNFPTLLVDDSGLLFKSLTEHFEKIWSSNSFSRSIPSEWVEADAERDS